MAHLTFLLPGDHRSGGVRVTVIMANLLLDRGHQVRIACPKTPLLSTAGLKRAVRHALKPSRHDGWLHLFRGRLESYAKPDDLIYQPGESVIAVGTYMVAAVREMTKPVLKVRFNHGFPARPDAEQEAAWHGRMPTITVSNTLVPRLQAQTDGSVWGVVPNGIDPADYFADPAITRDGIGALYNPHPNKAPENLLEVLRLCHERWPDVPQRVFGTEARPAGLEHVEYTRLPSVAAAREIYNRSKCWILTSRTEGLPGVVLEAMACGCVVVSTDNEGSLEILRDGENGVIVPRDNVQSHVAAIGKLLADEALARTLADGALQTVRNFTWERAADRMEEFLRDLPAFAQTMVPQTAASEKS
jgi:glycosyltransferase involved in cell wall biosynthesis